MRRHPARFRAVTARILLLLGGFTPTGFAGFSVIGAHAADPQPYEVTVRPSGDNALDDAIKTSAALISLREKAPVGGFALARRAEADADRFRDALSAFGYYNGSIAITIGGLAPGDPALPAVIEAAPAKPPIPVIIIATTGPRFHLGRIDIEGAHPSAVDAAIRLKPGQDALAAEVVAARDRLLAAIREAGYPMAAVTLPAAVVHRDTARLDVAFVVDTGRHATIGVIDFQGLRDMNEAFMRRRLLLRAGTPFSPTKIDEARKDLLSLGVFSSVRIVPAEQLTPDDTLPMTVAVTERKLHAVDLGAAYSTDLGPSFNASWTHRNLFGGAEQLILSATVQAGGNATTKPGYQIGAQYIQPDFLARDQSLTVGLTAVKQSLYAYDQTGLIERVGIERKLSAHWSVNAGLLGEQEAITQNGIRSTYNLAGVPLGVKYDSTDALLDAVHGVRGALSVTPMQSLGSPGGTFFLTQLSGATYLDFNTEGRSVLAMRGLVGKASGVGVFGLPPDQRFYAGGNSTVRGFRFQSIGPAFSNGRPTGGTAVAAGSVEFRQRILTNYGVVAFLDMGQVSATGSPFSQAWRTGAGIGARYYTSIGPIRLDVAVPLNRQPSGDTFEVYIGIGQAF